jgi:hypothetical protein
MEGIRDSGDRNVRQVDGYLVVEPGMSSAAELQSTYRAFAVLCIKNRITRALVKAIDSDPAGEYALRDAFTMMLLAGIPAGWKLALVADTPAVEARYRNAQRDLTMAGVEARLFANEQEALSWLA